MLLFTRKLNLINKNKEGKTTLTGPVIQQNELAISSVCFQRKILFILVNRELFFCFQILEIFIRAK